MKALMITGTDTNVGKTFIAYNLIYSLKEKGIKVGYLKPIETGAVSLPTDGSLIVSITEQDISEAVPVIFSLPLSPYASILEERKDFSLYELYWHYRDMLKRYDFLVVEGAGGIAVPVKKNYNYSKLARDWKLPVLLVAKAGLGTINHIFLSFYYIKSMGINILGIVMNGFTGEDVSERTNPAIVEELTHIKPVKVPRVDSLLLPTETRNALLKLVGF
ncbi:MAG: dethiobiotin synthase [Aquificaceae bacterium]